MSDTIIKSAQPAKQNGGGKATAIRTQEKAVEEKIRRLKLYVGTLGSINEKWLEKQKNVQKRKQKEDKYGDMVDDDKGLLNLINDGQEAIITLDMYKDEFEVAV
uniref:NAM-associated domain-containing protein n=1 Tax=Loa loa TaxID=7209 RepID=A0A1I7VKV5_LOALO